MKYKNYVLIIILFLLQSCAGSNGNEDTDSLLSETKNLFPAFSQFPISQFDTIEIGDTTKTIIQYIYTIETETLSTLDANHFLFTTDSTELIIPNNETINEFKVFLKGSLYLENETTFYTYLAQSAIEIQTNTIFSILTYRLKNYSFTLNYFKQKESIRLHFIQISNQK